MGWLKVDLSGVREAQDSHSEICSIGFVFGSLAVKEVTQEAMECAGKGRGTRCLGPPRRRCDRCGAVAYCSSSHQVPNIHKLFLL